MVAREGRLHGRVWESVYTQTREASKVELTWRGLNHSIDTDCLDFPDLVDQFDGTLPWE